MWKKNERKGDTIMLESAVTRSTIDDLVNTASGVPEGCIVEVGVWRGGTAWHLSNLAQQQGRQIFLYDTFEGIPYTSEYDYHNVGDFGDTDYEEVKRAIPYATVVKGLFPNSAIEMPPVAFLHVDVDQYQAVLDTVRYMEPFMVSGGIIWFDDAPGPENCVPGQVNGAHWALEELYGKEYNLSKSGKAYVIVR